MYPESYWNYRVIRKKETIDGEEHIYFGIHEVYYEDKKPRAVTSNPITLDGWESTKYLKNTVRMILPAFRKPVLDFDDFKDSGG